MQKIYIIVSKTTTLLARTIRRIIKSEFSHVSLSLDDSCENMISFGRKVYWNPFFGGLVDEGKNINFFKHFNKTEIEILELEISDEQHSKLVNLIDEFKQNRKIYSFNIFGMATSSINIPFGRKNRYFCSQFVAHLLKESEIYDFKKNLKLLRPHEFLNIPHTKSIHKGIIGEYVKK